MWVRRRWGASSRASRSMGPHVCAGRGEAPSSERGDSRRSLPRDLGRRTATQIIHASYRSDEAGQEERHEDDGDGEKGWPAMPTVRCARHFWNRKWSNSWFATSPWASDRATDPESLAMWTARSKRAIGFWLAW